MWNLEKLKEQVRSDETITRTKQILYSLPISIPSAATQYAIDKVPIVQWLPRYRIKWLLSDFVAGITIAVMLIPQALAYAKIATIPVQFGLFSSWLPAAIYVFMGTSKDLSIGPTSIMGLLTAEVIADLSSEGYAPQVVSSAVAMMVGVYSLLLGLFKLGFILDYVSAPVLSGFVSAAALTILLGQIGSLLGLDKVGSSTSSIIHDVLTQLPLIKPLTLAIGLSGIVFLYAMEWIGKRLGKKYPTIKFLSSSRAVLTLIIYTSISFGVNRDLQTPLFALSNVTASGILPPKAPDVQLLQKVALRSIAPLFAAALEHLSIGKAFGRKNKYAIDQSQELCYLGVTNIFNSFFGSMPVGGAMSRTAVNSECGVRSPLSGTFTAGFILLTIYKLAGVLFWIPKATLSAIIIMAVVHIIGPISVFYSFWRVSLADFTASMLAFWITLFVSTETGIAVAVGFSVGYTMIRLAFVKPSVVLPKTLGNVWMAGSSEDMQNSVSSDIVVLQLTDAVFFPNAERVKAQALESIQVGHLPETITVDESEDRSWSVASQKRLEHLRRMNGIQPHHKSITAVVLNFNRVPFIDVTGVTALVEFRTELDSYFGYPLHIRVVGLAPRVRRRFERADWQLVDSSGVFHGTPESVAVYETLEKALWDPHFSRFDTLDEKM